MKTTIKSGFVSAAMGLAIVGAAASALAQASPNTDITPAMPPDFPGAPTAPDARNPARAPKAPIDTPAMPSPVTAPTPAAPAATTPSNATTNVMPSETTTPVTPAADPVPRESFSYAPTAGGLGAGVLLGGGFEDFTNSNLRSMTSGGGYWNARLVAGTRQHVGLEAAYTGAARSIDALGIGGNAMLVSNGVEGALRGNAPIFVGRSLLEPFAFVGLGWQHYRLTNTNTNTSDVADNDDIMTVPFGTGFEYAYGMFLADARFTFRQTYMNDLLRATGGNLNNWSVGSQLGVVF